MSGLGLALIITTSFFFSSHALGDTEIAPAVSSSTPIVTEHVSEVKTLLTEQELTNLVYSSADQYRANRKELLVTVKCEAPKVVIDGVMYYDSTAKSDYPGEESYGLPQWNLPSNNQNFSGTRLTKIQATDAKYAVDLMASYFSKGLKRKWTCYRLNFS